MEKSFGLGFSCIVPIYDYFLRGVEQMELNVVRKNRRNLRFGSLNV
jgi:hypothetical protein